MSSRMVNAAYEANWAIHTPTRRQEPDPADYGTVQSVVYEKAVDDTPIKTVSVQHTWHANGREEVTFSHPLAATRPIDPGTEYVRISYTPTPRGTILPLAAGDSLQENMIPAGPAIVRVDMPDHPQTTVYAAYDMLISSIIIEDDAARFVSVQSTAYRVCNMIYARSRKSMHTFTHATVCYMGQTFVVENMVLLTAKMMKYWRQAAHLLKLDTPGLTITNNNTSSWHQHQTLEDSPASQLTKTYMNNSTPLSGARRVHSTPVNTVTASTTQIWTDLAQKVQGEAEVLERLIVNCAMLQSIECPPSHRTTDQLLLSIQNDRCILLALP